MRPFASMALSFVPEVPMSMPGPPLHGGVSSKVKRSGGSRKEVILAAGGDREKLRPAARCEKR